MLRLLGAKWQRKQVSPSASEQSKAPALNQVCPTPDAPAATRNPRRPPTMPELVGEIHMRRLHALFHMCDANEDGVLTTNELSVLLQLVGASENDAIATATSASTFPAVDCGAKQVDYTSLPPYLANALLNNDIGEEGSDHESSAIIVGASFESFLSDCREIVVRCYESRCSLPSRVFVSRCRPLKRGFMNCDTDGSLMISRTELEIALQKLGLVLGDDELDRVMAQLDSNADGTIEWCEFLFASWKNSRTDVDGDSTGHVSSTLQQYFNVEIFAELPSFIRVERQTEGSVRDRAMPAVMPDASAIRSTSSRRSSKIVVPAGYVSRIEQVGIRMLTRAAEARMSSTKRATAPQAHCLQGPVPPASHHLLTRRGSIRQRDRQDLQRTGAISEDERRAVFRLEAFATLIGAVAGVLFGLLAISLDSVIFPASFNTDSATYYVYASLLNIAVSLIEVHVLYLTTLVSAFQLTVSANLILYPLDNEREFLTRAIARAALQAGNRKDSLFGIDPMRGSPRLVAVVTLLLYKTKRYTLKFLLKLLIKRVLWRAAARTALSLLVLPVNALSNAWTLRRVMRNCRVNIIGPSCILAVLEVFLLEEDCFSPLQRVDYLRTIGCALVSKRAIHPNAEIMLQYLRHKWLCTELWPSTSGDSAETSCSCLTDTTAACKAHPLDDTDELLASLDLYGAVLDAGSPGAVSTRGGGPMSVRGGVSVRGATASKIFSTRGGPAGGDVDAVGQARRNPAGLSVRRHIRNVFFLLVISLIIDGSLGWAERRLFVRCCQAAGVPNHWSRVLRLKRAFVSGRGIDIDAVFALVESRHVAANAGGEDGKGGEDSTRVPVSETLQYFWNRLASLLSC